MSCIFFFFNDTATTEIYTLSLHDALPIFGGAGHHLRPRKDNNVCTAHRGKRDRKSTRLNSSHGYISYAVFCLKKKKVLQAAQPVPDLFDPLSFDPELGIVDEQFIVLPHA